MSRVARCLAATIALSALGACKPEPKTAPADPTPAAAAKTPAPGSATTGSPADHGPMTLAFQKVDYLPKDIPLLRADGSETTLGAEAGAEVLAVIPWASINCGPTLDFVKTLAPIAAGIPGLQLMPVSIDRVQTEDDRKVLHQVLVEAAVEQPLIVDRELKLLALINSRWDGNRPGVNALRLPALVLISGDLQRLQVPEVQSTGSADLRDELASLVETFRGAKAASRAD